MWSNYFKKEMAFYACLFSFLSSLFILFFIFIQVYFYNVQGCILCIYQRIPYAIILLVAGLGLIKYSHILNKVCLLLWLISAGLGTWHYGVEKGLWIHPCKKISSSMTKEDVLKQLSQPSCDKMSWKVLGISGPLANLMGSLFMASLCGLFIIYERKRYVQK